jgi:anti-anti-sigma factor
MFMVTPGHCWAKLAESDAQGVSRMKQAWPETLGIAVHNVDGYPCLKFTGEGECNGARHLEQVLNGLIEEGHTRIILDTREMRFLDPSCAESLVRVFRRLEGEGGTMVVVDSCLPLERALKLLTLEQLAHVVPSISQAMAYLEWHE